MAIVWPCGLDVKSYVAAGRGVEVPRPDCPDCLMAMTFRSGYQRPVRSGGVDHRVWVRRAQCRPCGRSHALLPEFCLFKRLVDAAVMGDALARAVAGEGMRAVAVWAGVAHSTVRGWRRRLADRASVLVAGLLSLVVALGETPSAAGLNGETGVLAALDAVVAVVAGPSRAAFRVLSVVSGGTALGSATKLLWSSYLVSGWMPPTV